MSASAGVCTPATWTRLDWDSQQFGFPAGRLTTAHASDRTALLEALSQCRAEGIRHLIARVDAGDLVTIHALEGAGFELLDGIQTFALHLAKSAKPPGEPGIPVRRFRDEDRAQVLAIARASYVHDRFHADSALTPEVADAVNQTWLENCCSGIAADAVFVACEVDRVLGFVTCRIDAARRLGVIGMVATLEQARERGVASAVTAAALHWFSREGAATVEVGTQLTNIAAARLYQNLGFRTVCVKLTLRKLL